MKLKKTYTLEDAIGYAKRYCSMQETSRKDVKDKLLKLGLDNKAIEKIILQLIQEDYINEQRYAELYTRSKIKYNKWGRIKIKRMLLFKGIDIGDINFAFDQIDQQEYMKVLEHLFDKKLSSLSIEDEYQKKYRINYFLSSHGFEPNLIEQLFKSKGM